MMATVIMMVGFIGLMEGVVIASNSMDHARRQTLAAQMINHEIEKMFLLTWPEITALATVRTAVPVDRPFWPDWTATASYATNRVVTYNGAWYRCGAAHANQVPTNATYWTPVLTPVPPATLPTTDIVTFAGATFTLARTVSSPDPVTAIREVNFVVTWVVATGRVGSAVSQGGSTTADGADDYTSNIRRANTTHTRANSVWLGKNGLHLSYPQS
jgi:hypothetical protein